MENQREKWYTHIGYIVALVRTCSVSNSRYFAGYKYCDMTPESRSSEVWTYVHC
jgi:hypothetical protein